ncbi:MAG: DNA-binding protein WhiA [Acholeplasmataceae bacterium]
MSFAKTVKEELVTIPVENTQEQLAEFAAFLQLNGDLHLQNNRHHISFKTNNPTVAKRFLMLTRTLYQAETTLLRKEQQKLTKKPQIIIEIHSKIKDILSEIKLLEPLFESSDILFSTEEAKLAFLRATFLSVGSVNHPKTAQYHLEMSHERDDLAVLIQSMMNRFELNAKIIKRRRQHVVYLKDAEHISEFMMRIGAQNSVFKYEDIRIKRDFNNSINRVMNCEIANEKKVYEASQAQIKDIKTLIQFRVKVTDKIKRIMDLRLAYEDANLRELTEIYEETFDEPISKSGLNHRFQKIKQLAHAMREGSNI